MEINKHIELLMSSNHKLAYESFKTLLAQSEKSNILYAYFDLFIEMMENQDNSFIRTRGLRLIAYNSKWDDDNKVNLIIEQWLKHLEDEKPITSRQCIQDTIIIAKNKPELIDVMLKVLEDYHMIYEDSMQSLIYNDRKKAIRQIKQYTW